MPCSNGQRHGETGTASVGVGREGRGRARGHVTSGCPATGACPSVPAGAAPLRLRLRVKARKQLAVFRRGRPPNTDGISASRAGLTAEAMLVALAGPAPALVRRGTLGLVVEPATPSPQPEPCMWRRDRSGPRHPLPLATVPLGPPRPDWTPGDPVAATSTSTSTRL